MINITKWIDTGILKLKNNRNNITEADILLFLEINNALIIKNIIIHHHNNQKKNIKSKNILWLLSAV